uniref:OBG-type G domain-containing protein n=2 Tax=Tetranychus urticae TaxID=32264 RepID=T1KJQ8_TETUR
MSPIGDLVKNGDSKIVAHGGQGGSVRNNFFGGKGQSQWITLDLRYCVDIGLVGYPDSGKSLLLTKLSTSDQYLIGSPEKSYKSKRPWLDDIKFKDGRLISCVDLPSLVEGAHCNDGLGHHYLKHLYHNQLILFVIDVHGFNRGIFRKPIETVLLLNKQIEIYDDRFLSKPVLIVVNKMDLPGADVAFEEFMVDLKKIYLQPDECDLDKSILPRRLIKYQDIIPISCLQDRNIDYVKQRVRELIDFNYMSKRDPDCPRTFISLLDRVMESRKQTKFKLL